MSILSLFGQTSDYDYGTYDYTTYDSATTTLTNEQAAGIAAGVMVTGLIIAVLAYVIFAFLMGRIFKKAGVEQWKAWVPIYNTWTLLELGGQQGFWAVLALIPVVNIVSAIFVFIAMYHIGLKLGKSGAFVLLAIFLPLIWFIWLAFDGSKWQGKVAATPVPAPVTPSEPTPSASPEDEKKDSNTPPTPPAA